jgi:tetratricopeptide (TPR) repeat protein
MKSITRVVIVTALAVLLGINTLFAQLNLPWASPRSEISQRIGISDVTITYHRPGVKDREIWGNLVPYGLAPNNFGSAKEMPWRAGANENTIITFSHDVKIEGQHLKAGSYGLHMIPGEDKWTIIFSNNTSSWGSFFYNEAEDALRVDVTPVMVEHKEWLEFDFDQLANTSATAYLHWEKMKVPFSISVDTHEIVLAGIRDDLRGRQGFNPQNWNAAARYCVRNNINHEEAIQWIDRSIAMSQQRNWPNFNNFAVKSQLLAQNGDQAEADNIMKTALETASENELNNYGYQLMNQGNLKKANEIFTLNVKRHKDSWNVYDSLAECQERQGDIAKSIKNYKTALKKAPEDQKERIQGILDRLQGTF